MCLKQCGGVYWKHGARSKQLNLDSSQPMYDQLEVLLIHDGKSYSGFETYFSCFCGYVFVLLLLLLLLLLLFLLLFCCFVFICCCWMYFFIVIKVVCNKFEYASCDCAQ